MSVEDIEAELTADLYFTDDQHNKLITFLTELMTANDMTLNQLRELCWEDSGWVFDNAL